MERSQMGIKAPLVDSEDRPVSYSCQTLQGVNIGRVERYGLLNYRVFSSGQGIPGKFGMGRTGRCYHHGIDLWVLQDLVQAGTDPDAFRRDCPGTPNVGIMKTHEAQLRDLTDGL
jgi:hypothetical protein